jgi:hypothetical protein
MCFIFVGFQTSLKHLNLLIENPQVLPPPVVAASDPSSLAAATPVGAGLVAYDYANARASAQ